MSDKKTSKDTERDLLAPVSFDEFEKPTYERWQAEVEKALKGGVTTYLYTCIASGKDS